MFEQQTLPSHGFHTPLIHCATFSTLINEHWTPRNNLSDAYVASVKFFISHLFSRRISSSCLFAGRDRFCREDAISLAIPTDAHTGNALVSASPSFKLCVANASGAHLRTPPTRYTAIHFV